MTSSRCPDPKTLTAYVTGRIDDAELPAIASHLIDCELCYETVAAQARLLAGSQRTDNEPPLALLPALLTGAVMALALTASLLLLID